MSLFRDFGIYVFNSHKILPFHVFVILGKSKRLFGDGVSGIDVIMFFLNIIEQAMTCVLVCYWSAVSINCSSINLAYYYGKLYANNLKYPNNTVY